MPRSSPALAALPAPVAELLVAESAPPRLVAHLTLVHDVALRLTAQLRAIWPDLALDDTAVAFGAATHDIGKARHPEELSGPGALHESAGFALLIERGVAPQRARFARTHGAERSEAGLALPLEDLLVITADSVWKARRDRALDDALTRALVAHTRAPAWEVFLRLDEVLVGIADGADARSAWQGRFGVTAAAAPNRPPAT